MEIATFDIETVPADLPEDLIPKFDPSTVKLGNIKDEDKIKQKLAIARAMFTADLTKRMSLHPDLCQVVCFVGYRYDTITRHRVSFTAVSGGAKSVRKGWEFIHAAYTQYVPLASYNGIGFDLPVLLHRAMLLNIPVPPGMYADITKRYSVRYHYDLMQVLSGWDRTRWESLDFYLRRFGIGVKEGNGKGVYKLWKEGKFEQIEEYCKKDVELTCGLFSRVEPWVVDPMDKPF